MVGGKAAALGEIIQLGIPVPVGFCVTTETYERCMLARENIKGATREFSANLSSSTSVLSLLPDAQHAIRREVLRLFALLRPGGSVAVRSSAVAEDSPSASFAGQFVSFIGIKDADEVVSRIEDCWASLCRPNVVAYQQRMNVPSSSMSMGVIVQRMIPAEAAGVLFTAHPTTGKSDEFLVEAGWGLGDTVVSGMQTPDTFLLKVGVCTVKVEPKSTAKSGLMTTLSASGNNPIRRRKIPSHLLRVPTMRFDKLYRLARMGQVITEHFGAPQDIEWALYRGRLYILQSRPITK